MTIQELREKRAQAWDEARNFLDSKRNDSGLLSEEDSKTYDKMEAEIVALGKEIGEWLIAKLKKINNAERQLTIFSFLSVLEFFKTKLIIGINKH